jgi:hypothetical protein
MIMRSDLTDTEELTGSNPVRPLLRVEPTPGISTSVHHVYRADSATRIGAPEEDEGNSTSRTAWDIPHTSVLDPGQHPTIRFPSTYCSPPYLRARTGIDFAPKRGESRVTWVSIVQRLGLHNGQMWLDVAPTTQQVLTGCDQETAQTKQGEPLI